MNACARQAESITSREALTLREEVEHDECLTGLLEHNIEVKLALQGRYGFGELAASQLIQRRMRTHGRYASRRR